MEFDTMKVPQTPARAITMDSVPRHTSPTRNSSSCHERRESQLSDAIDLESQSGNDITLTRTFSAPYSIFNKRTKMFIVASVSITSLISPLGATTFYPALNTLADQLNVTPSMVNLSLTTYMIAQAIAPAIIAGMSDNSGRRPSYLICYVIFIVANVGLALQTNYAALLVLRMVQAAGCSASIALAAAVVADISTSAERGSYMSYSTAGLLIGPAFGPTIGGLLAQYLGWRSIFWFLAIFTGVLFTLFGIFMPETCRTVVGNGSVRARGLNQSLLGYLQQKRYAQQAALAGDDASSIATVRPTKLRLGNPLKTLALLREKVSGLVLLYNGFFFLGMMVVSSALPNLFQEAYGFDELQVGLCYIALGAGSLLSTFTMGRVADWNFRRIARSKGLAIIGGKQQDLSNFPVERARFEVIIPGHIIGTLGLIIFGWTVKFRTHLAGPEIALFMIGFGTSTAFNLTNTLLTDIHSDKPATAGAAVNLVRCLLSAGGAAAILPMCRAMNPGWAFTFIGLVYFVWILVVFLIMKKGLQWRQEALLKKEIKDREAEKSARQDEVEEEVDTRKERQSEEKGDRGAATQ